MSLTPEQRAILEESLGHMEAYAETCAARNDHRRTVECQAWRALLDEYDALKAARQSTLFSQEADVNPEPGAPAAQER